MTRDAGVPAVLPRIDDLVDRSTLGTEGATKLRQRAGNLPGTEVPTHISPKSTDAQLLSAARAGRQDAWEWLTDRHGAHVRALVAGFRLQEADAADVVQSTWLYLVLHIEAVREPERLGGWLATVASRECLKVLRHQRNEQLTYDLDDRLIEPAPEPEALVMHDETLRIVRAALAELPHRGRTLLESMFYRDDDYATTARRTGIPIGSLGPTRARMLDKLRRRLLMSR